MTDQNYDEAVAGFMDSPEFDEAALAWAREHMRCETCRWYKDDPPARDDETFGFYGDGWCAKEHIQWHDGMVKKAGGCIQDWEPKP